MTRRPWQWGLRLISPVKSLRQFGRAVTVREIIAKRIIAAAKNGMRDPVRLHEQALKAFGIDEVSMCVDSEGRNFPVPACASIARPVRGPGRGS